MASVSNIANQLKYTGQGYLDYKAQPVKTVAELKSKFKVLNELFLGLTVTVLNENGDNVPVDYWFYYPYDPETGTYDKTAGPDWYQKVYPGGGEGGEIYWEDGAAPGTQGYEAWKDGGIE